MEEKTFEELLYEEEMKLKQETENLIISNNKNNTLNIIEEKKEDNNIKEMIIKSIIYNIINELKINNKKLNNNSIYEGKSYLERKKILNQQNYEWGSLCDLKKSYCRLEREQMKLREEKENNILNNNTNLKNEIKEDFNTLLNKKRINDNKPIHSGYTPIKKKKIYYNEKYEDFGTFMNNAIKSKPKIQIQKEKFLNSQNK